MKVTFITNYMTHHQLPFCLAMRDLLGDDFVFVETNHMEEERKNMGWDKEVSQCSFIRTWDDESGSKLMRESDIVLCGGTHESYIRERMDLKKITFRYFERMYKTGRLKAFIPTSYIRKYKEHTKRKNDPIYLLCAGAYVPADFKLIGAYNNKMYKWGYFTKLSEASFEEINEKRKDNKRLEILWTGRMLYWKHPELAIKAVLKLSLDYHLTIIGEGEKKEEILRMIHDNGLEDKVTVKGFVSNDEIRSIMEQSDIYLMTSDYEEGWGAVVNEAMDKGMTVIGSCAAGAVPYLIRDGENGLVFKNLDAGELADKIAYAGSDSSVRNKLGKNAYNTIHEMWNAKNAAERFMEVCEGLVKGNNIKEYSSGPFSTAPVVTLENGYKYFVRDNK